MDKLAIGVGAASALAVAAPLGALQRSELAKGEGTFVLPTMMSFCGVTTILGGLGAMGEKHTRTGAALIGLGIGAITGTVGGFALGTPLYEQWQRDNGVTP